MNALRRQAAAALAELNAAAAEAGLGLGDLDAGWQVSASGEILIRLRPLRATEIARLAAAVRPPAR